MSTKKALWKQSVIKLEMYVKWDLLKKCRKSKTAIFLVILVMLMEQKLLDLRDRG